MASAECMGADSYTLQLPKSDVPRRWRPRSLKPPSRASTSMEVESVSSTSSTGVSFQGFLKPSVSP